MRTRLFRMYLGGLTSDLLGDGIWFLGLTWAVTSITSPGTASLVLAAASVPRMALTLPAGVLVDRVGAMRVAQGAQLLRVLIMTGLLIAWTLEPSLAVLTVGAITFGVADALRMPASGSLLPALVEPEDLPAGQGIQSTLYRAATVAAAPAGGVLLAWHGFPATVLVNALLFVTAYAAYAVLKRDGIGAAPEQDDNFEGALSGFTYALKNPLILGMLSLP